MAGYAGFGSFHSDNVEEMVRDRSFRPPPSPVDELSLSSIRDVPFGHAFGRRFFHLDPSWVFVNHGAFGACLRHALDAAARWRAHAEEQPLQFIDRELFPHLVHAIREFAPHVGASPERLAFVQNATTGLNAVIGSVDLMPGDSIFMLDIGYGSVKKMCRAAVADATRRIRSTAAALGVEDALEEHKVRSPVGAGRSVRRAPPTRPATPIFPQLPRLIEAHVPLDDALTADAVVDAVSAHLPTDGSCRLAVFDHITSNTALRLPIERIAALCRHRGVPVLIDGAHGLMSDAMFLDTLGADYYCGNMHKWCAAPKGSAFLYVRDPTAPHHPPTQAVPPLAVDAGAAESPRPSPLESPRTSPRPSPRASPRPSPLESPRVSSPRLASPRSAQRSSPRTRARSRAQAVPRAPLPRPAILSHGAAAGFLSSFIWDGHRDYSASLAVPVALRFWATVGPQRAREYCRALARRASHLLSQQWSTGPLTTDTALTTIPMALVRLPVRAANAELQGEGALRVQGGSEGARRLPFSMPIPDGQACTSEHAKAIQVRAGTR